MRWIDGSGRNRYSSRRSEKPPLCPSAAHSIRISSRLRRRRSFWAAVLPAVFVLEAVVVPGDGHWDRQFGMPGTASRNLALRFNGNSLYTAGYSLDLGLTATNTVVNVFDGTNWSTIGGITGSLYIVSRGYALAASGNDLFVGGTFEDAGGSDAGSIARWNDQIDFTPPSVMRLSNAQMLPGNAFNFRATATERAAYVIDHSDDLVYWTPLTTNSLPSLDVTNPVPDVDARHYRMREIP